MATRYEKLEEVYQHAFVSNKVRSSHNKSPAVRIMLDVSGQHTLRWAAVEMRLVDGALQPVHSKECNMSLPAGECNLYTFPLVRMDGADALLDGDELHALTELILALATDPATAEMMLTPDCVGAYPIHALLVANTEASLGLAMRLFRAEPSLMLQRHTQGGPFVGENCLHIVAANSREEELLEMLGLAVARLPAEQLEAMLTAQCEGGFFTEAPMHFYGGTPLGYACVFCLKRAVVTMLDTGLVSLDSDSARCTISGLLPLHAVTANRLMDMYNWLTDRRYAAPPGEPLLKLHQLADPHTVVAHAQLPQLGMAACTPLQLAAQLGAKSAFIFLLHKQTHTLWKWGPVTAFEIDLRGVDSAGEGDVDVMEIIGRLDSQPETTSILLDDCMQGFVHKLFCQKWHRFGAAIHYTKLLAHLSYLALLILITFGLKERPEHVREYVALPRAVLLLLLGLVCSELRAWQLWWANEGSTTCSATSHGSLACKAKLRSGVRYFCSFHSDTLLVAYVCAAAAMALLLADTGGLRRLTSPLGSDGAGLPPEELGVLEAVTEVDAVSEGADPHRVRRALRQGAAADDDSSAGSSGGLYGFDEAMFDEAVAGQANNYGHEDAHALTLLLLAAGLGAKAFWLTTNALTPFQRLGVFMLSVNRMLREDIFIFLVLFVLFITNFYLILYTVYPRAGDSSLPEFTQFNEWNKALEAMWVLAFMGEPAETDFQPEQLSALSFWQKVDMCVFVGTYFFYVLMSIILLLNLLIAMMGHTFDGVVQKATLEWRLMFARYVLRLELTAGSLGWWDLNVGEKKGDRYIFSFRDVAANAEGGGASGNPFDQDLSQQNDYEQDAEGQEQRSRGLKQLELLAKMGAKLDEAISSSRLAHSTPPQANLISSEQRALLEERLQAMHTMHAESLAKLEEQQAALVEQVGRLVHTAGTLVAPKPEQHLAHI